MGRGIRAWAGAIKADALAVYLAGRDPRVPWHAKALALLVAAHAFSPLDLIPDFVPVLGLLDDLVLVPLGLWSVLRLVPPEIMAEHRERARALAGRPVSRVAAGAIVAVWAGALALAAWLAHGWMGA